ncbi:MAG: protein kinase, partial [Ktedonobacteraceae bacterium]|nr:protein kinase [Ktedonobacteraceae bacterium]
MVMLTCVNCHQPVTSTDGICEFCGAVLPSSNYPKSNVSTLTCPGCKAPLKLGADLCEHCGLLIDSGGQMQVAQPIPSAQPPSPSVLPPASLPASFSSSALAGQCPRCGRARTAGKKFCGGCGYSFTGNLQRGQVLNGRYRIEQIIGQGGMGVVYLAEDTLLKRKVVTKTLLDGNDKHLVAQSVKEREYLAKINHPNIVSIYDFVTEGTSGYIVMEYVQGKTLKQIMEEQGRPFDVPTAIRLMLGVLPAFAYLAKLNYVYCDFKPHNVMMEIRRDGTQNIKLIDLGTVIEYEPGVEQKNVFCTLGYFAPEATKYPSPQTDLYSICRTLAYMVTHMNMRQPLFGMPPIDKYQVFQDYPAFYRFLCKGTHSDPKQRFQSVEELEEQLRGVLRLCAGGATGELVSTRQFVSSMLASAGRIARCGETAIDEQDSALQILRTG